jgi:alkylation response protein AidB-like acyl-CoA dehydrogenase
LRYVIEFVQGLVQADKNITQGIFDVNFELTSEQMLLQDALAGYLRRNYRFEHRAAYLTEAGWRPDLWQAYAQELSLFRATLPLESGGFGGGGIETLVIAEQFGSVLALEPYIEAMVLGLTLLRESGPAADPLITKLVDAAILVIPALYEAQGRFNVTRGLASARLTAGTWRVYADKIAVLGAPVATHFLVCARTALEVGERGGMSLFLIDAQSPDVTHEDHRMIDGRSASDLSFKGAEGMLLGDAGGAYRVIECALDAAIAAVCAEAVGVMQAMLDQTIAYAKQRQQFGQAISRFQVLQHRMVDMLSQVEQSRSLAIMAALSLKMPVPDRGRAVSAAKAFISDAVMFVAQAAVQIHGAIGTTEECSISHYFRRATVISGQYGTAAHHRRVMAESTESTVATVSALDTTT